MQTPLGFDVLKDILQRRIAQLPDHRKESPNTRYAIQEAALGAFGIFFTQWPSFLEYQRQLQHTKGHNNTQTLFGMVSYFNCTTGKVSHSVQDHTWSARPAAIAGVRFCHHPPV